MMPRAEPFATKTNRRAITAATRAAQALALRVQGYSFPEIAQMVGYKTPYGAWQAVYRALKKVPVKDAQALRQLELQRTEVAMRALYPKVIEGDCNAIRRWTELIELRCRVLGLFAPTKVEHGVVDNDDDPLYRLLDALSRRVEASNVGIAALPAPSGADGDTAE
jgi:hypothetical protein